MSTPVNLLQNPGHSATQLQTQKVEMAQHEIKALGQSKLNDAEKAAKLRDTCENFESIFIQKMWQQMRETLPQENPLVGKEEKFWQSMYDQEFSKKMAQSGGIGLADMMYDQLSENLFNVSKTTAHASSDGKGFEINPAPIMPIRSLQASDTGKALDDGQQQLDSQDASSLAASGVHASGGQKYAGLYEEVNSEPSTAAASHAASQSTDVAGTHGAATAGHNTEAVQQFLAGLQAKQAGQGAATLTGPERAQQVQQIVGSPPPSQGVLPASAAATPQVLRYTTNVPKNERQGDAESHMRELMAKAAQQQAQPMQYGQGPWLQASPQQQASDAVQDALRKAQEAVSTQQVATAQTLPLTPTSAQPLTAPASPYAVPPMAPTVNKQQS